MKHFTEDQSDCMEAAFCQKDETIDPEKKEAVKMLREKAKKMVKDLQETCFTKRPRNWQKICEIQEVPWKNWSFL